MFGDSAVMYTVVLFGFVTITMAMITMVIEISLPLGRFNIVWHDYSVEYCNISYMYVWYIERVDF